MAMSLAPPALAPIGVRARRTIVIARTAIADQPCMGGWCTFREKCAHYWRQSQRTPAENLCGHASLDAFLPMDLPTQGLPG